MMRPDDPMLPAGVDLDSLLQEYDKSVPPEPKPSEKPAPSGEVPSFADRVLGKQKPATVDPRDGEIAELRDFKDRFSNWAGGVEQQRQTEREERDAAVVFQQAQQTLAEVAPHVPPDYATTWLRNQYNLDPALQNAWDHRHDSEGHAVQCQRRIESTMRKFAKHLRATAVDPQASEDRELVSAAVRGASGVAPPPAAPAYTNQKLSDAEFASEVERKHGFRPLL